MGFISFLFIGCEKDTIPDKPANYDYLVKAKIDLSNENPFRVNYEYDTLGRLIKSGDTTFLYQYSDTLIKQLSYQSGKVVSYTYHYLNSDGLVNKSVLFSPYAEPIIDNIMNYFTYKYDSEGHLIEEHNSAASFNVIYIWEGDNMKERIDGPTANEKIEYSYYMDKLNHISYGTDYFGRPSKNLLKQSTHPMVGWSKYTYEFDSKERPVKELETKMNYFVYTYHSGHTVIDSISSTYKREYEY